MLAAKIGAYGSMGMGFDASGSVLAVEIGAYGLMESVLVGFDSCGAGGFLFLWWRLVLVVDKLFDHERKRKKKMLVKGGELTVKIGRRRSLL